MKGRKYGNDTSRRYGVLRSEMVAWDTLYTCAPLLGKHTQLEYFKQTK